MKHYIKLGWAKEQVICFLDSGAYSGFFLKGFVNMQDMAVLTLSFSQKLLHLHFIAHLDQHTSQFVGFIFCLFVVFFLEFNWIHHIWSAGLNFGRMASQIVLPVLLLGMMSKYFMKSNSNKFTLFLLLHLNVNSLTDFCLLMLAISDFCPIIFMHLFL